MGPIPKDTGKDNGIWAAVYCMPGVKDSQKSQFLFLPIKGMSR
jgi:hypothetical protein